MEAKSLRLVRSLDKLSLVLKMEERATHQGMQMASKNGKKTTKLIIL